MFYSAQLLFKTWNNMYTETTRTVHIYSFRSVTVLRRVPKGLIKLDRRRSSGFSPPLLLRNLPRNLGKRKGKRKVRLWASTVALSRQRSSLVRCAPVLSFCPLFLFFATRRRRWPATTTISTVSRVLTAANLPTSATSERAET